MIERVCVSLANKYQWTPDQIGGITMTQAQMYLKPRDEMDRGDDWTSFGLSRDDNGFLTGSEADLERYADYRRKEASS